MDREKTLSLRLRIELPHIAFSLPSVLVGRLGPAAFVLPSSMSIQPTEFPTGCRIGSQPVGDQLQRRGVTRMAKTSRPSPPLSRNCGIPSRPRRRPYPHARHRQAELAAGPASEKWAIAIYLELTSLKSISSMKLHRDIGVSQPTAWFMLHRIRDGWKQSDGGGRFSGPVEVDETYMGGKRRNMSISKRKQLTGHGPVGKAAVVGIKDRGSNRIAAKVVASTDKETLQRFVKDNADEGAVVYTD